VVEPESLFKIVLMLLGNEFAAFCCFLKFTVPRFIFMHVQSLFSITEDLLIDMIQIRSTTSID